MTGGTKYDPDILRRKIEELDGSRSTDRSKSAVRIEDLQQLLQLVEVKTQTLTASPTMADFNSLLADVKKISDMLLAVATALQKKTLR